MGARRGRRVTGWKRLGQRRALVGLLGLAAALQAAPAAARDPGRQAALYPRDARRELTGADHAQFPGAGILYCRRPDGVPQKAAAAWLIGAPDVVVLNAHNFRDRRLETTRSVSDCYFQIGGRNYDFVA